MSNGDGLKKQWGVADPAKPPSDKQAQEFQAAFQAEIGAIGGHLQYTATNAEAAKHEPLAKKRDALYSAFQSTLKQVDPANPDKAKGAIDKVLGDAKALNAETAKVHTEAEKAKNDWDARQPKYDEAVKQVEELEAWEDSKAAALRGLVNGIQKDVNDRKFAQASKTLDAMLPKLEPIYKEYVKQKEAKEKYDPAYEALKERLTKAEAGQHIKLKPKQDLIAQAKKEMEDSAQKKDFVTAYQQVGGLATTVETYELAVEELEKQKKAYEDAWTALQPKLTQAEVSKFKKLETKQQEITAAKAPIEELAKTEEYEQALQKVNELSSKCDEYQKATEELEKQKKAYEDAWTAALQPTFDKCSLSQFKKLEPLQQELAKIKGEIDAAVLAEDFDKTLTMVNDLSIKVDAYLKAVEEAEKKKKEFEDALAALQPKLAKTEQTTFKKLEAKQKELADAKAAIEKLGQNQEYDEGLKQIGELSTKADEYVTTVEQLEAQKKTYEDAWAAAKEKITKTEQSTFKKLEPKQKEIADAKTAIEQAAQNEEFEEALKQVNEVSKKADEYVAAAEELQKQKKAYDDAWVGVQPKFDQAAQPPQFKKLVPQHEQMTKIKGQIDAAVQADDYVEALKQVNELSPKVDAYLTAVAETEKKKQAYDEALMKTIDMRPLEKVTVASLSAQRAELENVRKQMEAAAEANDYEKALQLLEELKTKASSFRTEVQKVRQSILDKANTIETDVAQLDVGKHPIKIQIDGLIASIRADATSDEKLDQAAKGLEKLPKLVEQLKNDPAAKLRNNPAYQTAFRKEQEAYDAREVASADLARAKAAYDGTKVPTVGISGGVSGSGPSGGVAISGDPASPANKLKEINLAKTKYDQADNNLNRAYQDRITIMQKAGWKGKMPAKGQDYPAADLSF